MTFSQSNSGIRNGGHQRSQASFAARFAARILDGLGLLVLGMATLPAGVLETSTANAAYIKPVNAGFETGDLSGWLSNSNSGFVTTSYGAFTPVQGQYMGVLQSLGPTPHTLTQSFSMNAGDLLSFSVGFQGGDYLPFDDSAFAKLSWGDSEENLFLSNISSVGNFGNSGWKRVEFVAPETNMYTLQLGVVDYADWSYNSAIVIDSAPEPGTIALMAIGMIGYGGLRYARRRKTA